MKRVELELEHKYKGRFVGRHRLKMNGELTVIGSSRNSHIRLMGEDVSGVHALVEYSNDVWTISDAGSEQGTWVKKKPIVLHEVRKATSVRIGGHDLTITPKVIEGDLFREKKTKKGESALAGSLFHQVIVRKNGHVLHSELMGPGESFEYRHGLKTHTLSPPSSRDFTSHEFGEIEIQHRLAESQPLEDDFKERLAEMWDPSLRAPAISAVIMFVLIFGLIAMAPSKPDEELISLKPEKNRYTKMIFDAKSVRKKRLRAQNLRKTITKEKRKFVGSKSNAKKQTVAKSKGTAPKVASKIKAAGISKLIGKISKRAAKSATFIRAQGKSPNNRYTGRALATGGSLSGNGKIAGNGGKTFKINGVGTAGKAGSSSSYKGIGGLAVGNVGQASVGVLEEETEIQGGLDRDVISRVIQSQLGQIRYCYERQLSASPDLYGKVLVKFTIGGQGAVKAQSVGLSTLNSAMVEGCILRRVAGWKFPQPKGGTNVLVTYPFLFKSTN